MHSDTFTRGLRNNIAAISVKTQKPSLITTLDIASKKKKIVFYHSFALFGSVILSIENQSPRYVCKKFPFNGIMFPEKNNRYLASHSKILIINA
jgi:hypothetical protein